MAGPWDNTEEPVRLGGHGGVVTLVEGSSFLACGQSGDITPGGPQGLFMLDTRFLSGLQLLVDGKAPEPLDVILDEPFHATFVQRTHPVLGHADAHLVVVRNRYLGDGLREDIVLHNFGTEPVNVEVQLLVEADFADLFEVKEDRVDRRGEYHQAVQDGRFSFGVRRAGHARTTRLTFSAAPLSGPQTGIWEARLEPRAEWHLCVDIGLEVGAQIVAPRFRCGQATDLALPSKRLDRWRRDVPRIQTGHRGLELAVRQAAEDLGVLRIFDPEHADRAVIAAGAPWFMTLFGRDSLLTSWMALLVDPDLALGVLQTLARFQGDDVNPHTEEQPGRILHEMRFGNAGSLALGGGSVYYGTVDATPLFVMLLGELNRWGLGNREVDALLPHADRALRWIEEFGDRDGDGYVEYARSDPEGLLHQGWKDSWDGTRFADGTFAQPPVALCEVQGYTYAAYLARTHFALQAGDKQTAQHWARRAADLKVAFNRDFWLEDRQTFAMGLDADKRPIDAVTSNPGHCLWTGIVDEDRAPMVAASLRSADLFAGWGVRTLSTSMAAYNPVSYHSGSVWPHDSALVAAGLMRYGFVEDAQRIALGLLDAAATSGGRLPELFCGFGRGTFTAPIPYPTSCSPQAWAAAAPLLLLRSLLRLDPEVPHGRLSLAPALPEQIGRVRLEGIPVAGGRMTVEVDHDQTSLEHVPRDLEVVSSPRQPITRLLPVGPR